MPTEAYPNLKQLDLPRCFVSVYHNFEIGRKLDISPSLFNNLYCSNNPRILAPFPTVCRNCVVQMYYTHW